VLTAFRVIPTISASRLSNAGIIVSSRHPSLVVLVFAGRAAFTTAAYYIHVAVRPTKNLWVIRREDFSDKARDNVFSTSDLVRCYWIVWRDSSFKIQFSRHDFITPSA
jgi:hypothetical protein